MNTEFTILGFSLYGTLLNRRKGICNVLIPLFEEYLIDMEEDEIYRHFLEFESALLQQDYKPYREVLSKIMISFSKALNINFLEDDLDLLYQSVNKWEVFEDVIKSLEELKPGFILVLTLNADDNLSRQIAERFKGVFDLILPSSTVQSHKPSPEVFREVISRMNTSPENILHVAESFPNDIIPCQKLGIRTLKINRYPAYKDYGAQGYNPEWESNSLYGLKELLTGG